MIDQPTIGRTRFPAELRAARRTLGTKFRINVNPMGFHETGANPTLFCNVNR